MKLKSRVKDISEVPEAFRELYIKQEDGSYVLDSDDSALQDARVKLKEFRDSNLELKKEKDKLVEEMQKFEGIDPAKYAEAKDALDKIDQQEEAVLMKAGKFDVLRQKWTEQVNTSWQKKHKETSTNLDKAEKALNDRTNRLNKLLLSQQANQVFGDVANVRQGAMMDILNRIDAAFQIGDDESAVAKPGNTQEDGTPHTLATYAKHLLKTAPYFFEGSGGGGSKGGSPAASGKQSQISSDPLVLGQNLEAVASGKMVVNENL